MGSNNYSAFAIIVTATVLTLSGCDDSPINKNTKNISSSLSEVQKENQIINLSMFKKGAFLSEPNIVDCETAQGTKTKCYELITSGAPAGREPGPFCPRTSTDGADVTGSWFSKEGTGDLVDLTGQFF